MLLADNRLMAVMRVYGGTEVLWMAFSSDVGKTWKVAGPMTSVTSGTVLPATLRLENGIHLLASGRPGLWLYATTNPTDRASWQGYNVIANHNRQAGMAYNFSSDNPGCPDVVNGECSAYTSLYAT